MHSIFFSSRLKIAFLLFFSGVSLFFSTAHTAPTPSEESLYPSFWGALVTFPSDLPPWARVKSLEQYRKAIETNVVERTLNLITSSLLTSHILYAPIQSGIDFQGILPFYTEGSIFDFSNLSRVSFHAAYVDVPPLRFMRFIGSNLTQANFDSLTLEGIDFYGAILWKSTFIKSLIVSCRFEDANISHSTFQNSRLIGCSFSNNSLISQANFKNCTFENCLFQRIFFRDLSRDPSIKFVHVMLID